MKSIISKLKFFHSDKILILLITITLILHPSCSGNRIERTTGKPDKIGLYRSSQDTPFIKLHMKNGEVYVLENWQIEHNNNFVTGTGTLLDVNRMPIEEGKLIIPFKDIVLAETNLIKGPGIGGLVVATIITGVFTIVCITNPKACFGSCPTFYVFNGQKYMLQAEGFSSSVMPSLEASDVDAMYNVKPTSRFLEIIMKNEALETHVVRRADLIAIKRSEKGKILSTPDQKFLEVDNFSEPLTAVGAEGEITQKICSFDEVERFSSADSTDLAEKEIVDITFSNNNLVQKGLVLAFRQTLLTTFLFYQSLAYMGNSAASYIAEFERNSSFFKDKIKSPGQFLGGIEVYQKVNDSIWIKCGEFNETGPIATNIQVLPLSRPVNTNETKIRLKMAKGMWRINYLSLVDIGKYVEPTKIKPFESIPGKIGEQNVIASLCDSNKSLVTLPGDEVALLYTLPDDYFNYDFFIEAQGYYLEWIRDQWLAEESSQKVNEMLLNPKKYLKDLAPQFKKVEAEMEETFWSSKYVLP